MVDAARPKNRHLKPSKNLPVENLTDKTKSGRYGWLFILSSGLLALAGFSLSLKHTWQKINHDQQTGAEQIDFSSLKASFDETLAKTAAALSEFNNSTTTNQIKDNQVSDAAKGQNHATLTPEQIKIMSQELKNNDEIPNP